MLGRALRAGLKGRCSSAMKALRAPSFPKVSGCRLSSDTDVESREYIEQWQHAQVRDQDWFERAAPHFVIVLAIAVERLSFFREQYPSTNERVLFAFVISVNICCCCCWTIRYERQSMERRYFFHVDLQGRLFLEETEPKNIATCLKQDKFLAFFFKRVRRNDLGWGIGDGVAEIDRALEDYPFISKCGDEMNFIRPADQAIVFEDLREATEEEKERMSRKRDKKGSGGDAETTSVASGPAPTHVLACVVAPSSL